MTAGLTTFAISLISAIIGAIIGGRMSRKASLEAIERTHDKNIELEERKQKTLVQAIIQSIYDEIMTLWESYKVKAAPDIERLQNAEPLLLHYPFYQEYFTIYNNISSNIGLIEDNEIRKTIIKTYTKAKTLLDNFKMNNELLSKYEHVNLLYKGTNNILYQQEAHSWLLGLIAYAEKIKMTHYELKEEVKNLIDLFQKKGIILTG